MRILFVKTSSLGDVIHHCPAVTDVRRQFPEAAIDWVVEESFAGIAELHPAIRRTIPVAVRRWRKQIAIGAIWAEMREFQRAIRSEAYDFVIDTQGLLKSALIASRALGERHGYDADSARESLASRFYNVVHHVSQDLHAVERNRRLTSAALGTQATSPCVYGLQAPSEHSFSAPLFCVMLSMTSRADKLWPEPLWAGLAKALRSLGIDSIFPWGNESEHARCQRIVSLAGTGVVPPSMPLHGIADMLSQAQLAIGVDTGLAHLAAALDVPVIGLYVQTDPLLTGLHGAGKIMNLGGRGLMPSVDEVLTAAQGML